MATNIFEDIYNQNVWGFGSGHGSLPAVTKQYRNFLQQFLEDNNIKSVVDYGAGDWQFSRYLDWSGIDYMGLEVVPSLIEKNNNLYGAPNIKFRKTPSSKQMPKADLLVVKDVLQHLDRESIVKFIHEVLPLYRFALITCNMEPEEETNVDIETGGFRPLDLRKPPFNVKASAVFSFGRKRRTYSFRQRKYFDPWKEVVLLVQN